MKKLLQNSIDFQNIRNLSISAHPAVFSAKPCLALAPSFLAARSTRSLFPQVAPRANPRTHAGPFFLRSPYVSIHALPANGGKTALAHRTGRPAFDAQLYQTLAREGRNLALSITYFHPS